ncbi:MAG: arginine N-succinyltransferase [Thermodesulfobacteriota bacterium]|nr:arginine N-succinyltransferase [Thermodesulfobacteriota bacterium]
MEENNHSVASKIAKKRFGCLQVFCLIVIAVIITAGITILVLKTYFFPSEFKPVTLNSHEEQALTAKLENLDSIGTAVNAHRNDIPNKLSKSDRFDPNATLDPEPYSEKSIKREINFTERELNALLAKNTDLAKKLAIDLSDDLISAKLLLPVDEDFPIFGGKTLRVRTGVVFTYDKGKPVVILKGITIMGVPIPNAWLGGIKNIDLVEEFGADTGFWKTFADGVEDIKIEEGFLKLKLME